MSINLRYRPPRIVARRLRFVVVGLVLGATAAVATSAIGFGSKQAQPPKIVTDSLERVAVAKTHDGKGVGLWLAPTTTGGQCMLLQIDGWAPGAPFGNAGRICSKTPAAPQAAPIMAIVNWLRGTDRRFKVLLTGRAAPDSGITRIELQSATGDTPLATGHGYFLASLGTTAESGVLPDTGTPYDVVGYGPRGDEIARVDLEQLLAAAQPKS